MTATAGDRILIAGCGRIGTRLGLGLAGAGAAVWGLRRRKAPLPAPLTAIQADLTRPETLHAGLPGHLDRVYFIATPGAYDDAAYERAYVTGLANLLDALHRLDHPPRRAVFVSSTAVYGQRDGEWVDETSPTDPNAFSGRRMLEAERLLRDSDLPGIAVRFGGIYGPGRTRMLDRVIAGHPCVADPPHYTNRIHEDDAVGILAHVGALAHPHALYLGVDDAPCTQCELMDWLAGQLGVPRPPRSPGGPDGGRGGNKRCRNDRLRASGFTLRHPTYREGYAAMLTDYRR